MIKSTCTTDPALIFMGSVANEPRPRQFARLRFTGKRYSGPEFPVEMLPELAAYRDLVIATARSLYFADHPGRKRVPRGFDASFGLVLLHVEEGSSVPILACAPPPVRPGAMPLPLLDMSYFDRARDLVEESARCVAEQRDLPKQLSPALGAKFGMFGRSLAPGETIFLSSPQERHNKAPYNADARKQIMISLQAEYWEDALIIGEITAADRQRRELQVMSYATGQTSSFQLRHAEQFEETLAWFTDRLPIVAGGRALYRRDGTLRELEVDTVSLVEEDLGDVPHTAATMPIAEQLESIAQLSAGWLDGRGEGYDRNAIVRVRECLEGLVATHRLSNPFIYPTPETEVRVEWPTSQWDVVITFDRAARSVWLLATATDGDDEVDERFLVGRPRDLAKLGIELERLLKVQPA